MKWGNSFMVYFFNQKNGKNISQVCKINTSFNNYKQVDGSIVGRSVKADRIDR